MNEDVGVAILPDNDKITTVLHTFIKYKYTVQCDYSIQKMVKITEIIIMKYLF